MRPTTIVEKDSSGLNMILGALQELNEERFIEGIRCKMKTVDEIADMIDQVATYQNRVNIEARRLSKFSETFIRHFATANNECFNTAAVLFTKIKSTIASLKIIFKTTTPTDHRPLPVGVEPPSVYEKSALVSGETQREIWDLDTFPKEAQDLYHALDTLFTTATTVLALCNLMIEKEEETRNDIVLLRQIYKESCEELLGAVKAASAFSINVENLPQNELEERRKKAGSEEDERFLRDGYHHVDDKVFTQFLILKAIREAQNEGLTEQEAFYWRKDTEKALRVRKVIENFHLVKGAKGQEGKLDSRVIAEFLKWCGVEKSLEKQLYEKYFIPTYLASHPKAELMPIGWGAIHRVRSQMKRTDESVAKSFENRLSEIFGKVVELQQKPLDFDHNTKAEGLLM